MKLRSTHSAANIALAVDTLIFSVSSTASEDTRKLSDKHLDILLVKRVKDPFIGQWCVPGGFVHHDETLEGAADRVLTKETNLTGIYKEQLRTFSEVDRDPRGRIVSTTFLSLADRQRIRDALSGEAAWFRVELNERGRRATLTLVNDCETLTCELSRSLDDVTKTWQYAPRGRQPLAFDHARMIMMGLESLRQRVENTDIVFPMMPREFTLGELQQVYETILGRTLWVPAFRRTIADRVAKTGHMTRTGGHRPSELYIYQPRKGEK